jgi:hypothetical protein
MAKSNLADLRRAHEAANLLLEKSFALLQLRWGGTLLATRPLLEGDRRETFMALGRNEAAQLLQDFYAAVWSFLTVQVEWEQTVCAGQPVSWTGIDSPSAHVWVGEFAAHLQGIIKQVTGVLVVKGDATGLEKPDLSSLLDKLDCIRQGMSHVSPVSLQTVKTHLESEWYKVQKSMESDPATPRAARRSKQPSQKIELVPGGFSFKGKVHDLTGKPRDMLSALLQARFHRCTVDQLRAAIRVDDDAVNFPEEVVKDTAKILRQALKAARKAAHLSVKNPLPSSGRGKDLTYILEMI